MLRDTHIRSAKPKEKPYRINDSDGLYIDIRPTGKRVWRYRFWIDGKDGQYTIGEYPQISLAEARRERDEQRELARQGINPNHEKKKRKLAAQATRKETFQALAEEWIINKEKRRTEIYTNTIRRVLTLDVYPHIGSIPVRQITSAQILDILRRVQSRGANCVAINIRQWLSGIFKYAVVSLRADSDPAAPLQGYVTRPPINSAKDLSPAGIVKLKKHLREYGGNRTTVIALNLLLLTFVRTKELRTAEWIDINLDKKLWKIPEEKMKKRRIHMVPLSKQSITLLQELKCITGGNALLFPNNRRPKQPMNPNTLNRALEFMGYNKKTGHVSAHDFRATASTHLYEMQYQPEHIEMQLAHAETNQAKKAYNHAQYLPQRIKMMQEWADYIDRLC